MKTRKFTAAFLVAMLCVSLFPKSIMALSTTVNWESKYTDNTRKVWKITFNDSLSSSIDNNNIKDYIYLQDYNNNRINVNITILSDRKTVEVSYPYYGYEKNKNYSIVILPGLKSSQGKKLNQKVTVPFIVNDFIYFKDSNLESEVRKAISKPKGGIFKEDVTNVQNLYLNNKDIESLEGLSYFTNLKNLYISGNKVKDLIPIKSLYSLEKINLENNQVEDISDLKGLYNLKELYLRGNKIQNIDSLSNLNNLTNLDLGKNKISKLNGISNLTRLTYLKLDDNYVDDISYLKNLTNLKTLYLSRNDITNYSYVSSFYDKLIDKDFNLNYPVSITDANLNQIIRKEIGKPSGDLYYKDLTGIRELDLSNASIYNLTGIKHLTSLEKLNLSGIKTSDFSELQYLKSLKELNLNNTTSYNKSFLSSLTKLEKLYLSKANVYGSDLTYLKDLVKLTDLDLSDNYISSNLEKLTSLNNLLKLNLKGNSSLTSIEPLKNYMKNLVYLNIGYTGITDSGLLLSTINTFPKLADLDITNLNLDKEINLNQKINFLDKNFEEAVREILKKYSGDIYGRDVRNIEKLELQNKNIADISGIEYFAALKYLDLSNNSISNIKPITSLTNLETLILHNNGIVSITGNNSIASLTGLTNLDLSNNKIANISSLNGLILLKRLDLSNNLIQRINELSALTNLEYLSLYNNKVGYDTVVAGQPTPVADLSYLRYMFNLKELFLGENLLVTDYSYIVPYYEKLQNKDFTIDLDSVVVKFYKDNSENNPNDPLKNAINSIIGNAGGDVYYKDIKNITNLDLSPYGITRFDGIEYFVNLTSLKAKGKTINDINPVGNLDNLKILDLSDNSISDISALGRLKNLDTLWLSNNSLSDVGPLKELDNLKSLKLDDNNSINDITPLKNLTSLTTLYLPKWRTNDFYLPVSDYYYNLSNKNFTMSNSNLVTIEKIDDIFQNINKGGNFTLPSTLTAKMTNGNTRQLEVIWDNYKVDTTIPGVYVYYGTVEGYTRSVKLTLNVMEDKNTSRGNSIGNIMNKGLAAIDGKWVYYSNLNDGGRLYKESLEDGQNMQLSSDEVSFINIYNGWVYFLSKGDMYKIKNDGSSLTRITLDNANYINVVDGYIYYFDGTKGGLWKINIDDIGYGEVPANKIISVKDSNNNPYSWDLYTQIAVEGDYVYFQNLQDGLSLYKMRLDKSEGYYKINTGEVRNINIYGDYLYFTEGNRIYKMSKNGSDKTSVTTKSANYINVSNGWIYFRNDSDGGKLYKVKTDGTNLIKLSDDKVRNINVVDNYVYYSNESNSFSLGKVRAD